MAGSRQEPAVLYYRVHGVASVVHSDFLFSAAKIIIFCSIKANRTTFFLANKQKPLYINNVLRPYAVCFGIRAELLVYGKMPASVPCHHIMCIASITLLRLSLFPDHPQLYSILVVVHRISAR